MSVCWNRFHKYIWHLRESWCKLLAINLRSTCDQLAVSVSVCLSLVQYFNSIKWPFSFYIFITCTALAQRFHLYINNIFNCKSGFTHLLFEVPFVNSNEEKKKKSNETKNVCCFFFFCCWITSCSEIVFFYCLFFKIGVIFFSLKILCRFFYILMLLLLLCCSIPHQRKKKKNNGQQFRWLSRSAHVLCRYTRILYSNRYHKKFTIAVWFVSSFLIKCRYFRFDLNSIKVKTKEKLNNGDKKKTKKKNGQQQKKCR